MKKLSFLLLLALASLPAFSLVELTDEEMSQVEGQILPSGLTEELERQIINRIVKNVEAGVRFDQMVNEFEASLRYANEQNIETIIRRFYLGLGGFGIPRQVIERQMEYNLYLQEQARQEAATLAQQRAIFSNLMDGLRSSLLEYKNNGDRAALIININTLSLGVINRNLGL